MGEPQGLFKMRFIGKPGRKLMKGAPGNYKQGEVSMQPFRMSRFPFWELLDPVPEVKVPPTTKSDSVFEDAVFFPSEEKTETDEALESPTVNAEWKTHMEQVMKRDAEHGLFHIDLDDAVTPIVPEAEEKPKRSRQELIEMLDAGGVNYSKRARTETLAKLVEKMESQ